MNKHDPLKLRLHEKIDYELEINALLPEGRGTSRRCFNQAAHRDGQDTTPSLSYDRRTGGWKCHACNEKGDLYSLFEYIKEWPYHETLTYLLKRYDLWAEASEAQFHASNKVAFNAKYPCISDSNWDSKIVIAMSEWVAYPRWVSFMRNRYGLSLDFMIKYKIGFDKAEGRVLIPIWQRDLLTKDGVNTRKSSIGVIPKYVNVRRFDCFRVHANWRNIKSGEVVGKRPAEVTVDAIEAQDYPGWEPKWTRAGKMLSVKDHGACYLYPMEVAINNVSMYLVGGELKALLLLQNDIPAVTFTSGEGAYAPECLPLFLGKRIRVLMDTDEAGVKAADSLSQVLANAGAIVEKCVWDEDIVASMPPKGDITDFLRMAGWKVEALDFLRWLKVERQLDTEQEEIIGVRVGKEPDLTNLPTIQFSNLVEPKNLERWIKAPALVAGRGDSPFAVPRRVSVTCEDGRKQWKEVCSSCPLPKCGFYKRVEFTIDKQMSFVGVAKDIVDKEVSKALNLPRCSSPIYNTENSAVEQVILTPTIEMAEGDDFEYAHRKAFIIREERVTLEENRSYMLSGKIMPEPKSGKFTFAVRSFEEIEGDILHYDHDIQKFKDMRDYIRPSDMDPTSCIERVVEDLREHVTHIYGQDDMLQAIALALFVPFSFLIKNVKCERICPSFMILGDTNTGKSTATKNIIRHYGAGRYAAMDSRATFAGIIGGNLTSGRDMSFTWGLLPTSHRGFVAMDEVGKLDLDTIGGLTNTLTSGIAERTTVNGIRKTLCHVRLLYLCNPRGHKALGAYANPIDAALGVMGTVQDLGRVEFLHIQRSITDPGFYDQQRVAPQPLWYTKGIARQHLQWAWSLKPSAFQFQDIDHLLETSVNLSSKFGANGLMLPAQTRFKLARLACGLATLALSSHDGTNVLVSKEHVQMAYSMFNKSYSKLGFATVGGEIHPKMLRMFGQVSEFRKLRFMSQSEFWSRSDLEDAFGTAWAGDFISLMQFELGLITKRGGGYFVRDPAILDGIGKYINHKEDLG